MKLKYFCSVLFLILLVSSCKTKNKAVRNDRSHQRHSKYDHAHRNHNRLEEGKPPAQPVDARAEPITKNDAPVFKNATEKYVYNYAEIAKEEMKLYGIPASITLAQGVLESSSGKGPLTKKSNNHFGIKCNGWEGEKVYHDDDAYQECFRKYKDPKYSFRDHSLFLKDRRRYAGLFKLDIDDYVGWARGLKKAGYATDPKYPDKLIAIIERYQLYLYDEQVLGKKHGNNIKPTENASVKTDFTSLRYTVKRGDTLYSISKRFDLSIGQLKKLNNLRDDSLAVGQKLYVKIL